MVRLIVEEQGARRAFRLGNGVLLIGSGPEARLVLRSAGVAEAHGWLGVCGACCRPS